MRKSNLNRDNNASMLSAEKAIKLMEDYFSETIRDKHGRYMSWRYCYKAFSDNRNIIDEKTIDYLALHLAFYLASWGMYRGSSFLLQKDYKIHMPIVEIIQEEKYNILHGITAQELCKQENLDLLQEIASRIKDCYAKEQPSSSKKQNNATDTLLTKILLGTLGCVPAYDRYYVESVKANNVSGGSFNSKSVRCIAQFYCKYQELFEKIRMKFNCCGVEYPQMKLMDMCFWQDGFEREKAEKIK